MSYRRTLPPNVSALVLPYLQNATTIEEFKRAQCIWLRASIELEAQEIALAIGWTIASVRQFHSRFLKVGVECLITKKRGGRRHENLTTEGEKELVRAFMRHTKKTGSLDVKRFQQAYERKVGYAVPKSTIYRLLERHGVQRYLSRPRRTPK